MVLRTPLPVFFQCVKTTTDSLNKQMKMERCSSLPPLCFSFSCGWHRMRVWINKWKRMFFRPPPLLFFFFACTNSSNNKKTCPSFLPTLCFSLLRAYDNALKNCTNKFKKRHLPGLSPLYFSFMCLWLLLIIHDNPNKHKKWF